MIVRRLALADAPAFVALRREMLADAPWAFAASPEDDQALNAADIGSRLAGGDAAGYAILGAFDDGGSLTASAGLMRNPRLKMAHRAHIWGVYVSPLWRGGGTGRAVMHATIETARSWKGVTAVGLSAGKRSTAAVALYLSLGFRVWGVEPECMLIGGETQDELHMTLDLRGRPGEIGT